MCRVVPSRVRTAHADSRLPRAALRFGKPPGKRCSGVGVLLSIVDEKTLPRGLFGQAVAHGHSDVRSALKREGNSDTNPPTARASRHGPLRRAARASRQADRRVAPPRQTSHRLPQTYIPHHLPLATDGYPFGPKGSELAQTQVPFQSLAERIQTPRWSGFWMSTMDAISLTAAPANASEIALEEDADLEELRQAQDLACPSIITILSPILTYWHRGPYEDHTSPLARSTEQPAAPFR